MASFTPSPPPVPVQTFNLEIKLKVYGTAVSPAELPALIQSAIEGDGSDCLFHAQSWTPSICGKKHKHNPNRTQTEGTEEPECAVCYEKIKEGQLVGKTSCDHVFHKKCLTEWVRKSRMMFQSACPMCRAQMHVNYSFRRSCDLLTRGPEQDSNGEVHFTRVLVPASGVHHNKMVYATRMYDRVPNISSF